MGKSIYLAGAMTARKDFGRPWRKKETKFLLQNGFDKIYDPCKFEETIWRPIMEDHGCSSMQQLAVVDRQAFCDVMKLIEEHDLAAIDKSDVILFYIEPACFKSDGTIHELHHCVRCNKDMIFLLKMAWVDIPSWCRWRIHRHGLERGKLFYRWDDLRHYVSHNYNR